MLLGAGHVIDGKYRLVRVIGTGGMGAVYEGENVLIRRRVAIKILHAASTNNADSVRRFEREAQAAGEIGNDHILEVLDIGSLPNGDRYLVMEYLDGETLAERIERYGRLTPGQIAPIARQFLTALVSAHAAGIIHRDLKPENIFIVRSKAGRTDFVKLIDFGISKFSRPFAEGEQRMTRADAVLGTPVYMSPEQARGASETDVRSDIYSCGVILYESVTGQLPFDGESFNDLMFKIALSDAPSPLSVIPTLDREFSEIINRAIARDPNKRFPSAQEFADAIDMWIAKNGVDETSLVMPTPDSLRRGIALRNAATISLDDDVNLLEAQGTQPPQATAELRRTGTEESWARSKPEPPLKGARGKRSGLLAAISVAGLLAVGLGIAVMVRPDLAPPPAHGVPAAAAMVSPSSTPSAVASAAVSAVAATPAASASSRDESAQAAPSVAKHDAPAARPATLPHSQVPANKPKAKSTSTKGFDLGY
jgi:serine/threonine-protein kinase